MPKKNKAKLTPEERSLKLERRKERRALRKAAEAEKMKQEIGESSSFAKRQTNEGLFTEQELSLPRPPPYLTGKFIGLWHASRKRMIKQNNREAKQLEKKNKVMVTLPLDLPMEKEKQIQTMLHSISTEAPPSVKRIRTGSSTLESARAKYQHVRESVFKDDFLQLITGTISEKINKGTQKCCLLNSEYLNKKLKLEEEDKINSPTYRRILEFRKKLPAFSKKDEILETVKEHNIVLISGETGCGKTTQVAQFILEQEIKSNRGSTCHIICTQPRRISTISVAERVSEERGERCGHSVGFQIRLEKNLPRSTGSILFCTTGILLQIMNSDPFLTEVSHVILDEIHERDTISDFVITVLKDILPSRPDLKVILMSATLNAEEFSKYFNNCPTVHIPGFTFPVKEYYLEDVYSLLNCPLFPPAKSGSVRRERKNMKPEELKKEEAVDKYIEFLEKSRKYSKNVISNLRHPNSKVLNIELIRDLIKHICSHHPHGAILVFLPGWDKISALNKSLNDSGCFPPNRYLILPLHSMMPTVSQRDIFSRPPPGVRKIVLATNIAETSITIDDIVYVIDSGKIKIKMFELEHNISTLREHWVSQANAKQRRGRAGRVQEGFCFHLFPKGREEVFDKYQLPEMMRIRLDEVILQAKMLQVGKISPFLQKVIDPPNPKAVEISLELLIAMNALDEDEQLTPLGYHLAKLPVDPQAGKMLLLAAMFSCLDPIASIASSISYKDPFVCPLGHEKFLDKIKRDLDFGRRSDHLLVAQIITQWEMACRQERGKRFAQENYLSHSILELLRDMKQQFADHLFKMNFIATNNIKNDYANVNSNNLGLLKAIICSGLYPNVAIIRTKVKKNEKVKVSIHTMEDGRLGIHPKSVNACVNNFESSFLVYYLKLKNLSINLHDSTLVYPLALIFFCHNLTMEDEGGRLKTLVVNKSIKFQCKASTAYLIQELRAWLDWLLEYKVSHPGVTDWESNSDDCLILRAIIELISTEHQMYYSYEEDDDSELSDSDV
ncbi:ATP-dependent RNA helicase Rhau [Rhodnius prolixus]|uniref:ATP-dependent RNA helicase Rhau n=1 Tax=Rhodnius prolixus TaxID=13249 RepID=UPI003D18E926